MSNHRKYSLRKGVTAGEMIMYKIMCAIQIAAIMAVTNPANSQKTGFRGLNLGGQ